MAARPRHSCSASHSRFWFQTRVQEPEKEGAPHLPRCRPRRAPAESQPAAPRPGPTPNRRGGGRAAFRQGRRAGRTRPGGPSPQPPAPAPASALDPEDTVHPSPRNPGHGPRPFQYCPDRRPRSPPTLLPGAGLGPPSAGRAQGPRRPPPALETDSHQGRRRLVAGRRGGGVTARISSQLQYCRAGGGGVSSRFPFSPFSDNKQEMRHAAAAQRR